MPSILIRSRTRCAREAEADPAAPPILDARVRAVIDRIDHLVLTVRSIEATCDFYTRCLGFQRVDTTNGPTALRFGAQKINVHQSGRTFEPNARRPTEGSADFCLVASVPLTDVLE